MRSVPLFFYHSRDELAIATSAVQLAERFSRPMNVRTQLEFLLFPYLMGSDTLYDGVEQLQSGELLRHQPAQSAQPDAIAILSVLSRSRCDGGRKHALRRTGGRHWANVRAISRWAAGQACRGAAERRARLAARGRHAQARTGSTIACASPTATRGPKRSRSAGRWRRRWVTNGGTFTTRRTFGRSGIFRREYHDFWRYACKGVSQPHIRDFPAVMQLATEGLTGRRRCFFPRPLGRHERGKPYSAGLRRSDWRDG